MRTLRRAFASAAVAAAAFGATSLEAQSCLGFASFSAGNTRIGGTASFTEGITGLQGNLAFGGTTGLFGGFDLGFDTYDNDAGTRIGVGGNFGVQVPLGTTGRAGLCPVFDADVGFGPEAGGADFQDQRLGAGLALGGAVPLGTTADLVPFGAARLNYRRFSNEAALGRVTTDGTYASLDFGAGLVFDRWLTLRPSVTIPFDSDVSSDEPIYRLGVHFTVGGGR